MVGTPYITKKKNALGTIDSINCAGATNNGTLTSGAAASGVNSVIPYTAGNGGPHTGQTVASTGVTGLFATLSAGSFTTGTGSLLYTITGAPSGQGTASFAINIGGKTCTLNLSVLCTPAPVAGFTDRYAVLYKTSEVNWNQTLAMILGGGTTSTAISAAAFINAIPHKIIIRDNDNFCGAETADGVDATPHTVISLDPNLIIPAQSRLLFYIRNNINNCTGCPVWPLGPVDIDHPTIPHSTFLTQYPQLPTAKYINTYARINTYNLNGFTETWFFTKVNLNNVDYFLCRPASNVTTDLHYPHTSTDIENGVLFSFVGVAPQLRFYLEFFQTTNIFCN